MKRVVPPSGKQTRESQTVSLKGTANLGCRGKTHATPFAAPLFVNSWPTLPPSVGDTCWQRQDNECRLHPAKYGSSTSSIWLVNVR
jgi:hypothetical protein